MSLKGKKVYHGSTKKIKSGSIIPHKATMYYGKEKRVEQVPKVYASLNKDFASVFMIKVPIGAFVHDDKIWLRVNKKDVNKLKTSGYIYTLEGRTFKKNYRVISNAELVSEKPAKILHRELIPNIYNYIMKNKRIKLKLVEDVQDPFK